MSAINGVAPAINIPAALLTALLVITGLSTVRTFPPRLNFLHTAALGGTSVAGAGCLLAMSGTGRRTGMTPPLVIFGIVGLIAGIGDMRVLRGDLPRGPRRLARHLWRMCFALFVATGTFFLGQAKVFPPALRIRPLLAVPVLLVLGTLFYWLWRLRRPQNEASSVRALSNTISTPTAIMR